MKTETFETVPKNPLSTIVFISVFGRFIVDERAVCEFLDEKLTFKLVSFSVKNSLENTEQCLDKASGNIFYLCYFNNKL